jgi:hypothetical protein
MWQYCYIICPIGCLDHYNFESFENYHYYYYSPILRDLSLQFAMYLIYTMMYVVDTLRPICTPTYFCITQNTPQSFSPFMSMTLAIYIMFLPHLLPQEVAQQRRLLSLAPHMELLFAGLGPAPMPMLSACLQCLRSPTPTQPPRLCMCLPPLAWWWRSAWCKIQSSTSRYSGSLRRR